MDDIKKQNFHAGSILLGIFVLAFFIQHSILLNWDVSWLIHATQRLIAGGSYQKDFFDTDPPMILYLYIPPVVLAKLFPISIIASLRLYIFALISFSLYLSWPLIQKILNSSAFSILFLLSIATALLILPLYEFGQREHIFLILTIPYLLLVTARIQGHSFKPAHAICLGVLAAFGIGIKPFFLLTPALIELYFIYQSRNLLIWARPEIFAIASVLMAYVVTTILYHQDYLTIIVPYAMRLYYAGMGVPLKDILLYPPALFTSVAFILYFLLYKINPYKTLSAVLMIALCGYLLTFSMQRTLFYYHVLPAFSFSILLLTLLFGIWASSPVYKTIDYITTTIACAYLSLFLYKTTPNLWTTVVFHPYVFYSFFILLFSLLIYTAQIKKNLITVFSAITFIILTSIAGSFLVQTSSWYPHRFILTLVILLLSLKIATSKMKQNSGNFSAAILAVLLFAYPFYFCFNTYLNSIERKKTTENFIQFLHTNAENQSLYIFSSTIVFLFPAIDYTETQPASRFPFFWMLPNLVKQSILSPQQTRDKDFLINAVAEDLNSYKPTFLLVDVSENKAYMENIQFNYLPYFSQHIQFKKAWDSYTYVTTIELAPTKKFQIYKRKATTA